jgi:hypothetical protein
MPRDSSHHPGRGGTVYDRLMLSALDWVVLAMLFSGMAGCAFLAFTGRR